MPKFISIALAFFLIQHAAVATAALSNWEILVAPSNAADCVTIIGGKSDAVKIGVSPWYWLADVSVRHRDAVVILNQHCLS